MRIILSVVILSMLFLCAGCAEKGTSADQGSTAETTIEQTESVDEDETSSAESTKEIILTDNYTYRLPADAKQVDVPEDSSDGFITNETAFVWDDSNVAIRSFVGANNGNFPDSVQDIYGDAEHDTDIDDFFDTVIVIVRDMVTDVDGKTMFRTTLWWPDREKLCCVMAQAYDGYPTELMQEIRASIKYNGRLEPQKPTSDDWQNYREEIPPDYDDGTPGVVRPPSGL